MFEYTPATRRNMEQQRDQYRPFQTVAPQAQRQQQPNLMQVAKAMKGLKAIYSGTQAAGQAATAAQPGAVGYGLGQSVQAGDIGSSTYAGQAAAGGTEASSAVSGGSSTLGQVTGGLGMAANAYGILQGMQTPQGMPGRDKGNVLGAATSAGSGAASGFSAGGPIGALVGAGLGLESYQWQHGNRKSLTSIEGLIKSELTGGLAARDIGSWTGLWE